MIPFVAKAGAVVAIFIREAEASSAAREASSRALECQNVSPG